MTHTTHDTTLVQKVVRPKSVIKKIETEEPVSKTRKTARGVAAVPGNTISGTSRVSVRSRNWFFTINNFTEKDIETIISIEKSKYVFQEERGESGTLHLQGVLMFPNARTFTSIKKLLPTAHIEVPKDLKASIKYCCKTDTRVGELYANIPLDDYQEEEDEQNVEKPLTFDETISMMNMNDIYSPNEDLDDFISKIGFELEKK